MVSSARYFDALSPLGVEVDSLADIFSFGVTPTILNDSIDKWSLLLFVFRKFNLLVFGVYLNMILNPAAAGVVALLALFSYVSSVTMTGVAFLMLCTLHRPKL
ncbi:unnamed protein product [Adineta ricciae]|uniref:Uncharacterized protein n=1 Tax=Adineta ricciae TaxID=249248 RepID=A0A815SID3_ADIRI|nr:unnamed protein product [Adineta ricciae]CAF1488511.1 unnamed protein product [Adineta ricciae]